MRWRNSWGPGGTSSFSRTGRRTRAQPGWVKFAKNSPSATSAPTTASDIG